MTGGPRGRASALAWLGECDLSLLMYCTALFVWLFSAVMMTSNLGMSRLFKAAEYAALGVCLLGELAAGRTDLKAVFVALALAAFAPLLYAHNGMGVLALAVFAYCGRRHDFGLLMMVSFAAVGAAFAIVVAGGLAGIIPSTVSTDARSRNSLGFGWVTFASHYYLNLVAMWLFLRRDRLRLLECALILVGDALVFLETNARNSFALVAALVVLAYALRRVRRVPAPLRAAFTGQFAACTAASAALLLCVNPYTVGGSALNDLLSGRIVLTQQAFSTCDVMLLGQSVTWVTQSSVRSGQYDWSQYFYVDNSYLNLLLVQGVLVFVVVIALLTLASYRTAKGGDALLCIILLVFAVHSIVDPQLLDLNYCCFLLLLGQRVSFGPVRASGSAVVGHDRAQRKKRGECAGPAHRASAEGISLYARR